MSQLLRLLNPPINWLATEEKKILKNAQMPVNDRIIIFFKTQSYPTSSVRFVARLAPSQRSWACLQSSGTIFMSSCTSHKTGVVNGQHTPTKKKKSITNCLPGMTINLVFEPSVFGNCSSQGPYSSPASLRIMMMARVCHLANAPHATRNCVLSSHIEDKNTVLCLSRKSCSFLCVCAPLYLLISWQALAVPIASPFPHQHQ